MNELFQKSINPTHSVSIYEKSGKQFDLQEEEERFMQTSDEFFQNSIACSVPEMKEDLVSQSLLRSYFRAKHGT